MSRLPRISSWAAVLALLSLCFALAACQPEPAGHAPGEPVAAVRKQAQALRDNDLLRYAELSLPPKLHAAMEARWAQRLAEATPVDSAQRAEFAQTLARLTAKNAEQSLYRAYELKIARLEQEIAGQWPMLQATATIFVKAAVEANSDLSAEEKEHATTAAGALLAWAKPSLLSDRDKARRAIAALTRSARALDLQSLEQTRALALRPALEKAGIALAGIKQIGKIYGLDADAALDQLKVELVSAEGIGAEGDIAVVKISYPLLGQTIAFEQVLLRRDGGWYSADAIAEAEADLVATPVIALDTPTGTAPHVSAQ